MELGTHPEFAYLLRQAIGLSEVAFLTTHATTGGMAARPMLIQRVDERPCVWFLASRSGNLRQDLSRSQDVLLQVVPTQPDCYLAIAGVAVQATDPTATAAAALWRDRFRVWFPDGPTDPDLMVLGVLVQHADLWDGPIHRHLTP